MNTTEFPRRYKVVDAAEDSTETTDLQEAANEYFTRKADEPNRSVHLLEYVDVDKNMLTYDQQLEFGAGFKIEL